MRKLTELLKFRETVYNRVKSVLLDDELISGLSPKEIVRLKSIYLYDFYDNVKRLTTEMALLHDKKRLGNNNALKIHKSMDIQIKNILFLNKKIVVSLVKNHRGTHRRREEQKDIIYE